jgi:hypothetical protein
MESTATMPATTSAAATSTAAATATMAATAAAAGEFQVLAERGLSGVFPVKRVKCRQAGVEDFLFAKEEFLRL